MTGPHGPAGPTGEGARDDDAYSATALGSHWFRTPSTGETRRDAPTVRLAAGGAGEDAGDGLLRFGPGVPAPPSGDGGGGGGGTASATAVRHGTPPYAHPAAAGAGRRRPRLRRYALAAAVLLAVLAYLAWQRLGPDLAVEHVAVRTDPDGPGCDGTADVVGAVTTNGRAGTIRYRWLRSDGTSSGVLEEEVARGQRQARLHLLWTFRGEGVHRATARLEVTSPGRHTAGAAFTYRCP